MINIVIPMAGEGSRFKKMGYAKPKPFIDVLGKPMIHHVLNNLRINGARYILIGRKSHINQERETIEQLSKEFDIILVELDTLTEGTLCTTLFARKYFNSEDKLIIANSDQLVNLNLGNFVQSLESRNLDGLILGFKEKTKNNKWSYVKLNSDNLVTEVKEKEAISDLATVGIYLFNSGIDYINYALDLIINNDRVNNEFYTCPVYNYYIKDKKSIGFFEIDKDEMIGLGTPEDLDIYLENVKC